MGSRRKDENNRVSTLLTDTITLLCKNGLTFKKNLKVQGLLGITVDDDEVFIVHLNETLGNLVSASVPENESEQRLSSRNSENGQRTPKRKRRRKSTDSQSSAKSPRQDSVIDLDLDVEIKTEPDMIVVDEVKFEGLGHQQTSGFSDEGLNFAVSSITTPNPNIASGSGGTIGGQFNSGATTMTNSSGVRPAGHPYATALVPNVADTSNQSSVGGSFQWDSSAAQGIPGMSNWASQITQQTMSPSDMSQQPGPSQGYSPGQRTGTNDGTQVPYTISEGDSSLVTTMVPTDCLYHLEESAAMRQYPAKYLVAAVMEKLFTFEEITTSSGCGLKRFNNGREPLNSVKVEALKAYVDLVASRRGWAILSASEFHRSVAVKASNTRRVSKSSAQSLQALAGLKDK